jgi:hypothetical protein
MSVVMNYRHLTINTRCALHILLLPVLPSLLCYCDHHYWLPPSLLPLSIISSPSPQCIGLHYMMDAMYGRHKRRSSLGVLAFTNMLAASSSKNPHTITVILDAAITTTTNTNSQYDVLYFITHFAFHSPLSLCNQVLYKENNLSC